MEQPALSPKKKFETPEEELIFLRKKLSDIEKGPEETSEKTESTAKAIKEYSLQRPEEVLEKKVALSKSHIEQLALDLDPEEHDRQMEELLGIVEEKGVKNALSVVEKLNNPHIEDDFHRFLVAFIKHGHEVEGVNERAPLFKALRMTLFEVTLPEFGEVEEGRDLKSLISAMEQFYAGMLAVSGVGEDEQNHFTLEIVEPHAGEEVVFYVATPNSKKDLFEKQLLAVFHSARVVEKKNDYNIFNNKAEIAASHATLASNPIFPLKTYEQFDVDPLNVILNAFSKLEREGEGASLQIVFKPVGDLFVDKYKYALEQIQKGTPLKEAIDIPFTVGGSVWKIAQDFWSTGKKKKEEEEERKPVDEAAVERIRQKISAPIISSNIRIVASALSLSRAQAILEEIESAFHQFEATGSNKLVFKRVKNSKLKKLIRAFTFRLSTSATSIPLNTRELTTIAHFPSSTVKMAPQLKRSKTGTAPAPLNMSTHGILLGINSFRHNVTEVRFAPDDRRRHFYVIGQTGTGKTTLLKNMIIQDIENGEGVCMIDPHGTDIEDVLASIPKERFDDVIYFNPAHTEPPRRPFAKFTKRIFRSSITCLKLNADFS